MVSNGNYEQGFKELILNSNEFNDLKEYNQSYVGYSRKSQNFAEMPYHTYTCSFSTNSDSLSMWNYYAASAGGVNIVFDYAWNLFKGSERTEVNIIDGVDNDIMIYRGLVVYKREDKEKCIAELINRLSQLYEDAGDEIEEYKNNLLYAFKEAINHMRCFFKNEHFKNEEEYRVVLKIPEEYLREENCQCNIKEKGVFKRGNILIPYVDYEFHKESIKRITMNPYIKDENSVFEISIKNLLWMNKMKDIEIVHSNIPMRKYD